MSNIEHRISKEEVDPGFRGDDPSTPCARSGQASVGQAEGVCEDCRFVRRLFGLEAPRLICENKAGSEDNYIIVGPVESCANFDNCGHTQSEIAAALAEGAKLIPLSQDKVAIVDAEDYDRLNKYKWSFSGHERGSYGQRTESYTRRQIMMHRVIMGAPGHLVVDHINHNGLDNRKRNLRLCTQEQNIYNSLPRRNCSSKYKGVYLHKRSNRYHAAIGYKGKRFHLGTFKNEVDAAKAYDKKACELFGEFAYLNF